MKKSTRIMMIVALGCIVVGGILATIGWAFGGKTTVGWDNDKKRIVIVEESDIVSMGKTRIDKFTSIELDATACDVEFIESDGYYIEYSFTSFEQDDEEIYTVENGVLKINDNNDVIWTFSSFSFDYEDNNYIRVYYPEGTEFAFVDVHQDMGSLNARNIIAEKAEFTLEMGSAEFYNVSIMDFTAEIDMGSVDMDNCNFENLSLDLSMGDLEADGIEIANNASISADMGSVEIELTSDVSKYGFDVDADMGSVEIFDDDKHSEYYQGGDVMIKIDCDMGSVDISR